jgi:hypothetical protein
MDSVVVSVSQAVVYRALSAVAAVLEESHCVVGRDELHTLVLAHAGLLAALGHPPEYAYRDGAVVQALDLNQVIKRSPADLPSNPLLASSYFDDSSAAQDVVIRVRVVAVNATHREVAP